MKNGDLYLMPVWLGEHGGIEQLPPENIALAARITLYFCEHEKTARKMLRRMVPDIDMASLLMHRLDKDTTPAEARTLLAELANGKDGAIISEAGMPGIADPGALLVQMAHTNGIHVHPLTGPSSLFLALAASGLNGQHFTFVGYLPRSTEERKQMIKRLEGEVERTGAAQLMIETPYRNDALLADLLQTCKPETLLCIAADITQPNGSVITRPVKQWRLHKEPVGKRPAVLILGRWA
ncbi:MAG: SAM-dependent methyltransferase [Flavobacteriales bacterium]|nr:SAM-dependent methyltransferase [Flavobacteriales bacterium]MBK6944980.1 SAM-dependent methyltransferase [Flavobacteriales bacterium]MBK7239329.1 SAM-dependent methyltransferase [Flavobacteriales bacterium]MBK9535467.1 SAM-dependent methyltransferase [Flavobacteriales bacterium]MBP9139874.1 SAM-dependent methyltransferase [Flavobacteriales bacterium]